MSKYIVALIIDWTMHWIACISVSSTHSKLNIRGGPSKACGRKEQQVARWMTPFNVIVTRLTTRENRVLRIPPRQREYLSLFKLTAPKPWTPVTKSLFVGGCTKYADSVGVAIVEGKSARWVVTNCELFNMRAAGNFYGIKVLIVRLGFERKKREKW